ncbi:MAG: sulfotransferase [Myxococcota bacterium]
MSDEVHPQVIGAGWGRTGTSSLKLALERLGFGPCHHMEEVVRHRADVPVWEAAVRGEPVDWRALMRGWRASCDFPSAFYWRELHRTFPDAKVVLTVRDPDRWYDSFAATIYPLSGGFPSRVVVPWLPVVSAPLRVTGARMLQHVFGGEFEDRAATLRRLAAWNDEVRATVPAEQLLVFDVREGWAPLCAFLGVPVPDEPFPRVNDKAAFQRRVRIVNAISWSVLLAPVVAAVALLAWALS